MRIFFAILMTFVSIIGAAFAETVDINDLPENFPHFTTHIYDSNSLDEGNIFLAVASDVEGVGYYLIILNNDGTLYKYKKLPDHYAYDFKVQPNGYISYAQIANNHSYTGGGDCVHTILDSNLDIMEEIQLANDYFAEGHDFQLLPNGHVLAFGYYMSQVDMSQIIPGGHPAAQVSGGIIQELDAKRNALFQWRTWDYYNLSDFPTASEVTSQWHLNAISLDVDGNIFASTPVEVMKIDRQTGQIMYHLGGDENEFTFIGEGADPNHMGGHAFHRLENGNILIYDNGNRKGTKSSQVHEYKIHEPNKTAELVWNYTPDVNIPAWHRGNAQRLPNGNTFIGWGGASGKIIPTCSEVTPDGNAVLDIYFDDPAVESYRAFKMPFPGNVKGVDIAKYEIALGNTYEFKDGDDDTGVTLRINDLIGDGYNEVSVKRMPYAPLYPQFAPKAPRVLPLRFIISQFAIQSMIAQIRFDVDSLNCDDPNVLKIYFRPFPDNGLFIPLNTSYNPATNQVRATMFEFGEYILGYPDIEEITSVPLLNEPESLKDRDYMTPYPQLAQTENDYTVNQELPVSLSWNPVGLAGFYNLQISTDPNISVTDVNEKYIPDANYTFEFAEPNTSYFWRVNAVSMDKNVVSDWSCGSFRTVPPEIQVISPNGGETLKRGTATYICWKDNLNEDVIIEIYKGDTLADTIAAAASNGAISWEVSLTLDIGDDYSIKIKSSADETICDISDENFSIVN